MRVKHPDIVIRGPGGVVTHTLQEFMVIVAAHALRTKSSEPIVDVAAAATVAVDAILEQFDRHGIVVTGLRRSAA